jgi:hypothetical protein
VLVFALLAFAHAGARIYFFWVDWLSPIYWCMVLLPIGLQMVVGGVWGKLRRLRLHRSVLLFSVFAVWGTFEAMGAFLYVQQFLTHLWFCPFYPLIVSPLAQSLWKGPLIVAVVHSIVALSLFSFGWGGFSLQAAHVIRRRLSDLRIASLMAGWCTLEITGTFIYVQHVSHYMAVGSPFHPLILSPLAYLLNGSYLIEQHGMIAVAGSFEVAVLVGLFLYSIIVLAGLFISWALMLARFKHSQRVPSTTSGAPPASDTSLKSRSTHTMQGTLEVPGRDWME